MAFGADAGNAGIGDTLTLFEGYLNGIMLHLANSVLAGMAGTTMS